MRREKNVVPLLHTPSKQKMVAEGEKRIISGYLGKSWQGNSLITNFYRQSWAMSAKYFRERKHSSFFFARDFAAAFCRLPAFRVSLTSLLVGEENDLDFCGARSRESTQKTENLSHLTPQKRRREKTEDTRAIY